MAISAKGVAFTEREEGFVGRAYRCPAGELTIGSGLTNRSKAAVAVLGKITPGMTITREQNARALAHAFATEYGPPVDRALPGAAQHELDAGYSLAFNCGPGAARWRWARLFAAGLKAEAVEALRGTAVTGGGKRLPGLVARRQREARLLSSGDYGRLASSGSHAPLPGVPHVSVPAARDNRDTVRDYQTKLKALGCDPGPLDGIVGPRTRAAVFAFQEKHPQLRADGILGRATMAAVDRAEDARKRAAQVGTVAAGAGATTVATGKAARSDAATIGAGLGLGLLLLLVAGGVVAWRYRDELTQLLARGEDEPGEKTMKLSLPASGKVVGVAAGAAGILATFGLPEAAKVAGLVTPENVEAVYVVIGLAGSVISTVAGFLPNRKAA